MIKNTILSIALIISFFNSTSSFGQVGIGTTTPLGALDITSTDDGILIPRVALTASSSALPLTAPTTSEMVYNTATVADVTPGYYYWNGTTWIRLSTGSVVETDPQVSSTTGNAVPKWNGTTLVDGIITDNGSTVTVAGTTSTTNFQMTNGAAANFVLQSNATGNASWVNANTLTITETDPQVSSTTTGRVPRWNNVAGTLQDGVIFDNTVSVGIGTVAPAGVLDITSTNNGLLIPRVALTVGTAAAAPLVFPTTSEIIYNTATIGDVTPGYYYWGGTGWLRIATTNSNGWSITGNTGIIDGTNFIGTAAGTNVDVAFRRNNAAAGKIGLTSTSFGVGALSSGAATNSTAIGNNALSVSTGNNNVAIGQNALRNCAANADFNTAVGTNALQGLNNPASNRNTVVGFEAMGSTTGDIQNCTAVGFQALYNIDGSGAMRGINNTAIGYQAGNNITTGENNIAIGYQAQVPSATGIGQVAIGNSTIGYAGIQVPWTTTSDKRWKDNIKDSALGLNFLKTLRPVSYIRNNDKKQKTEYGFIAQEIETAFQKAGDPNNGVITKDDKGMLGVRYNDFIPISVKAIQEQQSLIEALQKSNEELRKSNEEILKRLKKLEENKN